MDKDELDYNKIGLKCGLEIHQQLDTTKLFCSCPSILRKEEPDFIVRRKLHAVAGEEGKVDVSAAYEASQEKKFEYQGYDTTCLVELDEEPPHTLNKDALQTAIHIALLLNAQIIPITQIMRKTVIDGSNTSGFQRTAIIARDGFVETSFGKVRIDTICLEEDSARIVSRQTGEKGNISIFRLDRLGIPLVEIATAPDILSPEQAKETALLIGGILRTCKVRRGIGTIRQDINISIKPGRERSRRVELKGFQDPKIMIKTVEIEIARQKKILAEGKMNENEVRNVLPNGESEFLRPMPGAARMYPETDLPILKISRDDLNEAKKTIPKSSLELEKELAKKGLNNDMIKMLLKEGKMEDFKELLGVLDNPVLVAKMILMYTKEIEAKNKIVSEKVEEMFSKDVLAEILESIKKGKIAESEAKDVMIRMAEGESLEKALAHEKQDINQIENLIIRILKEKPGLSLNAYMGMALKELNGKAGGKEVMEIIKRHIK